MILLSSLKEKALSINFPCSEIAILDPSKMSSSCPPIKLQYRTSIWFFFAKLLTLLNLSFSFLIEYGDAEIFINNFEGLSFKYFLKAIIFLCYF